jgi:hypothetical protein
LSRRDLTWFAQTARLQLERLLVRIYVRLRRAPIVVHDIPRPARTTRGMQSMRLTHVLLSSDLNQRYLDCWPTARRVWSHVVGLEALLILIAAEEEVPADLRDDPGVAVFPPIPGIHTAFQAQCIRLLYPALVPTAGAVLTSDIDMVPLSHDYFHGPARYVPGDHFVAYRDELMYLSEIPVCYNAAAPRTWGSVFGVESPADVRGVLSSWGASTVYDGARGGRGWNTDQVILYRTLTERARARRDVWILRDAYSGWSRLNGSLISAAAPDRLYERGIRKGDYSDYHLLMPLEDHARVNEFVIHAAVSSAQVPSVAGSTVAA